MLLSTAVGEAHTKLNAVMISCYCFWLEVYRCFVMNFPALGSFCYIAVVVITLFMNIYEFKSQCSLKPISEHLLGKAFAVMLKC